VETKARVVASAKAEKDVLLGARMNMGAFIHKRRRADKRRKAAPS